MADIELVIKIPEEKYNYVKKQVAEGIDNPLKVYIANGIQLPEHGRLIDADKLSDKLESSRDCHDFYKNEYQNGVYTGYDYSLDEVANAPTII